jgi:hypothetical protein
MSPNVESDTFDDKNEQPRLNIWRKINITIKGRGQEADTGARTRNDGNSSFVAAILCVI